MPHLGEQAITGERQHDHEERLGVGVDPMTLTNPELGDALDSIVTRVFVERHWNAKVIREAASRLRTA